MVYLYETHLHTAGVSKCALSLGPDYISGYRDKGYSGIIVTDHFFNANCALSRKLPWEEWVNRFYYGYEIAKEEGDRQGFDVFFGWEETFDGCDDYLIYGLDKDWLLAHPECRTWTRGEQYRAVREAGGCVVQAHPFRQRDYIQRVVLSTGCVDAVEIVNGG
ncbi:MAG: histidinol-phosphatase, partial [Treponema sp.]|nr:histidinol-phosphatase [Treponema sp.]